jgi:haloacetate dehalogenase
MLVRSRTSCASLQPVPFPETLIGKDPNYFLEHSLNSWCGMPGAFAPEALAAYREAFRDPAVIHATCEDYRAGIGCDCRFDEVDRAGRLRKQSIPAACDRLSVH